MKIIDAHVQIGNGVRMRLSVDALLGLMDEAEIDFAIVSPMDRYVAVANRAGNDLVIDAVKAHPDRLAGMAVANPWFGAEATAEIRRALDAGLVGLHINSVLQGFRLSEHLVDPLLEVAAARDVPVYAHTGTAGVAEPYHLVELARRFAAVNFIMGHAGASDYYDDAVCGLGFVDNVWMETSRNGPANFCHWKSCNVSGRAVFGSAAPEYVPEVEIANLCDVFTDTNEQSDLFANAIRRVFKGVLPL